MASGGTEDTAPADPDDGFIHRVEEGITAAEAMTLFSTDTRRSRSVDAHDLESDTTSRALLRPLARARGVAGGLGALTA
ncbi:hypothetical protein [Sorangium sp. So ce861]|uniref:hypothetical protein n=1 Tax=Sorangium sp. So ce861 TaxID=3133323 RepID=UPI003F5E7244